MAVEQGIEARSLVREFKNVRAVRGIDLVREALAGERDLTTNVVGEPSFVLMRREAALRAVLDGEDPRDEAAVAALADDGLVRLENGVVSLPD